VSTVITRKMEIDMGHRVPRHAGKCANLHGHRYVIEVEVSGVVHGGGTSEEGMVMDFGKMKSIMHDVIDGCFDHTMCLGVDDPFLDGVSSAHIRQITPTIPSLQAVGGRRFHFHNIGTVVVLPEVPTAENLASVWYRMLRPTLSDINIDLKAVTVYETPNCWATYRDLNQPETEA